MALTSQFQSLVLTCRAPVVTIHADAFSLFAPSPDRPDDSQEARIPMNISIGDDLTHLALPATLAGPGDTDDDELDEEDESDLDDLDDWDEEDDEEDDEEFEDWEDEEDDVTIEDDEE